MRSPPHPGVEIASSAQPPPQLLWFPILAAAVFYYLSYEGTVDLDRVEDPAERRSIVDHIQNFGQVRRSLCPLVSLSLRRSVAPWCVSCFSFVVFLVCAS